MAAHQAPSSLGFSRQERWSGLPFPFPTWKWKVKGKSLSSVRLFTTPWTVAYQAPLSMGFSRQEYWSGVPLPSPFFKGTMSQFLQFIRVIQEMIPGLVENQPGFGDFSSRWSLSVVFLIFWSKNGNLESPETIISLLIRTFLILLTSTSMYCLRKCHLLSSWVTKKLLFARLF